MGAIRAGSGTEWKPLASRERRRQRDFVQKTVIRRRAPRLPMHRRSVARKTYPAAGITAPLPMPYPTRMQPARPYLLLLILLLGLLLLAWVTSREPRPGVERGAIRYRRGR
jgi:hypothetical protein